MKKGAYVFLTAKVVGQVFFSSMNKEGDYSFFPNEKGGQEHFFTIIFWGANTFIDNFKGTITFFWKKVSGWHFFCCPNLRFPDFFHLFRLLRHLCNL